jgi:uncharacterized protein YjbI with pentapeptide repeats
MMSDLEGASLEEANLEKAYIVRVDLEGDNMEANLGSSILQSDSLDCLLDLTI